MRKLLVLLFFAAGSQFALGQFTTVTGTVTDPTGLPYSGGVITVTLISAGTPVFTATKLAYTPPTSPVGMSQAGSFVMQLADVALLTPGGSTYTFNVCSGAATVQPSLGLGPVCFSVSGLGITGPTVDISANLNAAALALSRGSGGGGGVTPGTAGRFASYNSGTTIASNSNLDDSVTTPATITSAETFAAPQYNVTGPNGILFSGSGGPLPTGNAGIGIFTGGIPQINVNNTGWFPIALISVGGTASTVNVSNFNNTTPSAPLNGFNINWQISGTNVSAALVGDGNAGHCFVGTGVFAACPAGVGSTPLSNITAATGSNTVANGNNGGQTWQSQLTTNGVNFLNITESLAGTATSASLFNVATLAGSTVLPATFSNSLTGTQTLAALTVAPTWNTTGVVQGALVVDPTVTASGSNSLVASFQKNSGATHLVDITQTGDVLFVGGMGGLANGTSTTFCGGPGVQGCAPTNIAGQEGGGTFQGGDNSASAASGKAGPGVFRGGFLTNAAPNAAATEGLTQIGAGFIKGAAIAAVGDVVSLSAVKTVTDTSHTTPVSIIGIATNTGNPIGVVTDGQALVRIDSATPVLGDTVCAPSVTDGQAHDNGTNPCPLAGTSIGTIIDNTNAAVYFGMVGDTLANLTISTASPSLVLVQLRIGK